MLLRAEELFVSTLRAIIRHSGLRKPSGCVNAPVKRTVALQNEAQTQTYGNRWDVDGKATFKPFNDVGRALT
jgi:hypothetical protein